MNSYVMFLQEQNTLWPNKILKYYTRWKWSRHYHQHFPLNNFIYLEKKWKQCFLTRWRNASINACEEYCVLLKSSISPRERKAFSRSSGNYGSQNNCYSWWLLMFESYSAFKIYCNLAWIKKRYKFTIHTKIKQSKPQLIF